MADNPIPNADSSSDQYTSGLRAGCLLGCSPLIVLVLLFLGMFGGPSFHGGPTREKIPPAVALPRIEPATPVAGLLPTPPQGSKSPVYLGDDLSCVPELMLEAPDNATRDEWQRRKAHTVAAALHLNGREEDGYLKELLKTRPELEGVPFVMGKDCRTTGQRARAFKEAAEAVRRQKGAALLADVPGPDAGEKKRNQFYHACLAVVAQVIPTGDLSEQQSLIRGLSSIPRPEATRALARLAVFSPEEAVRAAALEALAVRRGEDATEVFAAALRYPWPAVAENAANAIVKLKREDLVPQLEVMLEAPDPRGPRSEDVAGEKKIVAHELVRVNHLRNCLLCHAPAEPARKDDEMLVAEIPVPTTPLPDTSGGYGRTESHLLVRIDVTYLRQDFSAKQKVTDWTAESWPPTQRFDYFVQKRLLTPTEAAELLGQLSGVSPYQRAAARALRLLMGRDVPVKPAAERSR